MYFLSPFTFCAAAQEHKGFILAGSQHAVCQLMAALRFYLSAERSWSSEL